MNEKGTSLLDMWDRVEKIEVAFENLNAKVKRIDRYLRMKQAIDEVTGETKTEVQVALDFLNKAAEVLHYGEHRLEEEEEKAQAWLEQRQKDRRVVAKDVSKRANIMVLDLANMIKESRRITEKK